MINESEEHVRFFSKLYERHGDSARTLDWGSQESQNLRFEVLAAIAPLHGQRIVDLGCGLADLLGWLRGHEIDVEYTGVELTPALAERAAARFPSASIHCMDLREFGQQRQDEFDYVFASGLFYRRNDAPNRYLTDVISLMYRLATKGIAFNSLSAWSDDQHPTEFYADPLMTIDYCRSLTQRVVLRHDYHPGDFSIYMYKQDT